MSPDGAPAHPDLERLRAAPRSRLADALSLATDPGIVVVAVVAFVALRATSTIGSGLAWAGAAILFCVLVPYAVLFGLLRAGRVGDRQIVRREQRLVPGLAALVSLAVGLAVLFALDAPRALLALMLANVAGLVTLILASLIAKASLHTSVVAGAVAVLVVSLGWWGLLAAPLVAAVGWARVRAGRHTTGQVLAGALLGALSCGLVFGLLH